MRLPPPQPRRPAPEHCPPSSAAAVFSKPCAWRALPRPRPQPPRLPLPLLPQAVFQFCRLSLPRQGSPLARGRTPSAHLAAFWRAPHRAPVPTETPRGSRHIVFPSLPSQSSSILIKSASLAGRRPLAAANPLPPLPPMESCNRGTDYERVTLIQERVQRGEWQVSAGRSRNKSGANKREQHSFTTAPPPLRRQAEPPPAPATREGTGCSEGAAAAACEGWGWAPCAAATAKRGGGMER